MILVKLSGDASLVEKISQVKATSEDTSNKYILRPPPTSVNYVEKSSRIKMSTKII